jgi:ketosteroid isomerase-like protein
MHNDTNLARRTLLALAAAAPTLIGWRTSEAGSAPAAAELPSDLVDAVHAYDRATVTNDIAALAQLVRDDYMLVNSDSTLQDKQSYLEDFKVPGFKLDPYVVEQPLRRLWDNSALIAGVVRLSWTLKGERRTRLLRIAHVWTRHDGRWRMAYTQLTRIPEQ